MEKHFKSNRIGRWLWAGVVLTFVMIAVILIRIQLQRRAITALPFFSHKYHEAGLISWVWDACGFEQETLPWQPALKLLHLELQTGKGLSEQQARILADQHTLETLVIFNGCPMSRAAWEKLRSLTDLGDFAWFSGPIPGSLDVLPQHLSHLTLVEAVSPMPKLRGECPSSALRPIFHATS